MVNELGDAFYRLKQRLADLSAEVCQLREEVSRLRAELAEKDRERSA